MKKQVITSLLTLALAAGPLTGCAKNPDGTYRVDIASALGLKEGSAGPGQASEDLDEKPFYVSKDLTIVKAYMDNVAYFGQRGGVSFVFEPVKNGCVVVEVGHMSRQALKYRITSYWYRPLKEGPSQAISMDLIDGKMKYLKKTVSDFKLAPRGDKIVEIPIPKGLSGQVVYHGIIEELL